MRSRPRSPSQPAAACRRAPITSGSSSSRKPNIPQELPWELVERGVDLCADATDHATVPPREEQLRLAVLEEGVEARIEEQPALDAERGNPVLLLEQAVRSSMNSRRSGATRRSRPPRTRRGTYMPTAIDLFEKARRHERLEQLQAARRARPHALLPGAGGPGRPRGRDGGAERIMLGSNNYLGLTGDSRAASRRARRSSATAPA